MISIINFFIYIFLFLIVQIFILKYSFFLGNYSIYIYILFVLVYPYNNNKKYKFLILSFFIGWIIDNCINTSGIHIFSTTLSAFLRLKFLQFFDGNNFIDENNFSIYKLPIVRQIFYIFSLVFTHYISLLILQLLKGTYFNKIILFRFILSSIFTAILCIIYFFSKRLTIEKTI